jgi:hypothetical protein
MTALEAAQVFGEKKPANSFDLGLDSWLATVARPARRRKTVDPQSKSLGANFRQITVLSRFVAPGYFV